MCDTDPLKLHYSWSLWRIGAGSRLVLQRQVDAYREMMGGHRIGFADAYLVSIPDPEVLELRRTGDRGRRRRNFALHARLGEPLREWYARRCARAPYAGVSQMRGLVSQSIAFDPGMTSRHTTR